MSIDSNSNNNLISTNRLHDNGSTGANDSIRVSASDNNQIVNNQITDTAGTGFAINIFNSTSDNNYLADNSYSGTGATTINNAGTGTIFGGQRNSSGSDFTFRGSANSTTAFSVQNTSGTSVLNVNTTTAGIGVTGTLGVTGASTLAAITTSGNFSQTGATTFSTGTGANTLNGATSITSTLSVTGNATFDTNTLFVDATNNRVGIGDTSPSVKLQVDGGFGIGPDASGAISSTYVSNNTLQIATDTAFGGIHDNHSGYLMYSTMPAGWTSARLSFAVSNNWGTYNTSTPALTIAQSESTFSGNVRVGGASGGLTSDGTNTYLASANGTSYIFAGPNGGYIAPSAATANNQLCSWLNRVEWCTSSRTLKNSITDTSYGLNELRQIRPVQYAWNADGRLDAGFIAEEVALVIPETTQWNPDGTVKSFSPDPIISVLTKSVQELDLQVQSNTSRISFAESRLSVLESTTTNLTKRNLTVTNTTTTLNLTVTGTATITNLKVTGLTELADLKVDRIITKGNTPTAVLGATTTGQGSTYTIEGNDTAGTITYTSGTNTIANPLASGEQVTVTFNNPFTATPRVTLTPTSEGAANIRYYVLQTETDFKLIFTDTPVGQTDFSFNYQILQ
jgi:hypothetical protein